jgi:hypothetical protein
MKIKNNFKFWRDLFEPKGSKKIFLNLKLRIQHLKFCLERFYGFPLDSAGRV